MKIQKLVFYLCFLFLSYAALAQEQKFEGESTAEQNFDFQTTEKIENSKSLKIKEGGVLLDSKIKNKTIVLKPTALGLQKPEPFISTYLSLEGLHLDHDRIIVYQRSSSDLQSWSDWNPVPFDGHVNQKEDNRLTSSLFYLDKEIKFIQYKIEIKPGEKLILKNAILKHYSPGATPKKLLDEINNAAKAQNSKATCSKPGVVSRSQWGARPPRSSFPSTKVTHLIVHHEFGSNSSSDWAARVRSVQNFHMNSNGWSDIGYNFLIDPNGVIYEGRAGGDSAVGAHFCGRNQNTMGVCMLGDYSSITPKAATQNSLARLLAWKASKENLNPTGSSYHYSVNGSLNTISGHRDGGGCSACPGNGGYAILPSIRTGAQNLINNNCSGGGGGSDTTAPTTSISATGGNSQSGDFTANFTDKDNIGVTRRFYQALEKYGDNWYANRGNGFFNDNFDVFYSGYTTGSGSWAINNKHLSQSNTSSDNTKLSTFLSQNSGLPYLYEFAAKVNSTSGPRKFGIHIMASDASLSQRGNSYLIWFSGEDNKVRIYETVNNVLYSRSIASVSQDNNWANYKITYSPAYGVIEIFKNNTSLLKWTDTSPIKQGSSISLRTNATSVLFDDLKVYKFRANSSLTIKAGAEVTDDIRRRNGKIKSLVRDAAGNWSTPGNLDVTINSLSKQNEWSLEKDIISENAIVIYPNPNTGRELFAKLPKIDGDLSDLNITLTDISGKIIASETVKDLENNDNTLNLSNLIREVSSGYYLIRFSIPGNVMVKELLIQ